MADNALENAKALRNQLLERKAGLRKEREAIDVQLNDVEKFIAQYESFAAGQTDILELLANKQIESLPKSKTKPVHNPKKEEVAEAARVIIARHGKPLMRADLHKELLEEGFVIRGKDPEMVLSTMLWRQKHRVVRLKKGGYWLVERPWELDGYTPPAKIKTLYEMQRQSGANLDDIVKELQNLAERRS